MRYIAQILFLLFVYRIFAQNIWDYKHSRLYAKYLYNKGEYGLALKEYQRLNFFYPDNDSIKYSLACLLLKNKKYISALQCQQIWLCKTQGLQYKLNYLYANLLLLSDSLSVLNSFLLREKLMPDEIRNIKIKQYLIAFQGPAAYQLFLECDSNTMVNYPEYKNIIQKALRYRRKKVWLAGCLSIVVPGSGKIYLGEIGDGLYSFCVIGLTAFAAYRGFNKEGMKSIPGWCYTAASTAFYLGNVYGSFKAAKYLNLYHKNQIKKDVENLIYSEF